MGKCALSHYVAVLETSFGVDFDISGKGKMLLARLFQFTLLQVVFFLSNWKGVTPFQ